jgi:integral membrane protein
LIAFMEGVSFLLLLLIAMPLKYLAGWPLGVKVVGMAHGVLFIAYIALVALAALSDRKGWPLLKIVLALIASLLPFGTFWAEYRLFRHPDISADPGNGQSRSQARFPASPN